MTLEQQVCSLELSKKLKELGVKQDSLFNWGWYVPLDEIPRERGGHLWRLSLVMEIPKDCYALAEADELYAAFTTAELVEMLPWMIKKNGTTYFLDLSKNGPQCKMAKTYSVAYYDGEEAVLFVTSEDDEADARATMLIYLIENNLLKV